MQIPNSGWLSKWLGIQQWHQDIFWNKMCTLRIGSLLRVANRTFISYRQYLKYACMKYCQHFLRIQLKRKSNYEVEWEWHCRGSCYEESWQFIANEVCHACSCYRLIHFQWLNVAWELIRRCSLKVFPMFHHSLHAGAVSYFRCFLVAHRQVSLISTKRLHVADCYSRVHTHPGKPWKYWNLIITIPGLEYTGILSNILENTGIWPYFGAVFPPCLFLWWSIIIVD